MVESKRGGEDHKQEQGQGQAQERGGGSQTKVGSRVCRLGKGQEWGGASAGQELMQRQKAQSHLSPSIAVSFSPKGLAAPIQCQGPDLGHCCKATFWHQYGVHSRCRRHAAISMTDAGGSQVNSHQGRRTGCVCWDTWASQAKGVGDSACQECQSVASDCICSAAHAMFCHQFWVLQPHASTQASMCLNPETSLVELGIGLLEVVTLLHT